MAKVVLGIGSSQSPLVSIDGAHWGAYGAGDKTNDRLFMPDGSRVTYEQLAAEVGDRFKDIVALPNFTKVSATVQMAVKRISDDIAQAKPDVVVVIGDDQAELFERHCMPAVSIYHGAELATRPWALPAGAPDWLKSRRNASSIDADRHYPAAPDFATELIERLIDKDIDVAAVSQPANPEKGIGHAWAFVANRLLSGRTIPIVPVILNTWYPPNVPTPSRCYELGQALRAAIEASARDLRVVIVASGGMSHFVLNEALDRQVVAALASGDVETLTRLPRQALLGGSGQIRDWITLAGAVEGLTNQWIEYQPGYRSPAGTGCGLAFATWS